jgi:signal transduction histidine kinase
MNADSAFAASLQTSSITVTVFTLMVILYATWHRDTPGLRWWAITNVMLALTLQLYVLRGDDWFGESQQSGMLVFTTIWLTGLLLSCMPLTVLAGITETLELPRLTRIPVMAALVQVASHTWFTYGEPSVAHRAMSLAIYLGCFCGFNVFLLLRRAGPELRVTARIAAAAFALMTLSYAYRVQSVSRELAAGRPQSSVVAGRTSFKNLAGSIMLWTFALIIMAEQKRRSRLASQAEMERKEEARRHEQRIREELSRDLHDTLSGTVATISLLSGRKAGGDASPALEKIHSLAHEAGKEVRMLLNKLSHPHASERTWMAECRDMAESVTKAVGLQLDWHAEGRNDRMIGDPMAALGLMRAIKEALNNIVRHAGASQVRLHCVANEDQLEIRVHDDGAGIPENHVPGYGLANIRSRVRELGGAVAIVRNGGTEVRFTIPLPLAVQAAAEAEALSDAGSTRKESASGAHIARG